jgi:hypothetical protein
MESFVDRIDARLPHRGPALLHHAMYNKGSAFTREERAAFGLEGLLPHAVNTIEQQAQRVFENLDRKTDPLEKYIGLASLQDRNEPLFYHVLGERLEEYLPVSFHRSATCAAWRDASPRPSCARRATRAWVSHCRMRRSRGPSPPRNGIRTIIRSAAQSV